MVLLILLLNACSTTECLYISDEDFPETIRLEKKGGFDVVARVDAMIIVGDMLLIRADQSSDIFSLYDLKGNLKMSWGEKGRALGEYMIPMISKVDSNSFMV